MEYFSALFILSSMPTDSGPVYAETDFSHVIVEPWNAVSSLAYIVPVIYWLIKLRGGYKEFIFLSICLLLLFFGGLGSTLFHAFRISPYLLFLDVFPIALLTFFVSVYFWLKVLPKWWYLLLVLSPFFVARYFIFYEIAGIKLDRHTSINVSYFISGLMIFLPAIFLLKKKKFKNAFIMTLSCFLFSFALFFREVDMQSVLFFPMGTHWLWHVFSAAGSWVLGIYLYKLRQDELN